MATKIKSFPDLTLSDNNIIISDTALPYPLTATSDATTYSVTLKMPKVDTTSPGVEGEFGFCPKKESIAVYYDGKWHVMYSSSNKNHRILKRLGELCN